VRDFDGRRPWLIASWVALVVGVVLLVVPHAGTLVRAIGLVLVLGITVLTTAQQARSRREAGLPGVFAPTPAPRSSSVTRPPQPPRHGVSPRFDAWFLGVVVFFLVVFLSAHLWYNAGAMVLGAVGPLGRMWARRRASHLPR
jgi:Flp pilus assembly protein TadB